MESYKVFDDKLQKLIHGGLYTILLEKEEKENEDVPMLVEDWTSKSTSLTCSYCRIEFTDANQHREHYKLDWHRYNLKLDLMSKPPITEEQFTDYTDDISSISGSESENEETLDTMATAQGKIFLRNVVGQVLGMYRCLLVGKKMDIDDYSALKSLQEFHKNNQWTVLMLGGGHFAGAVFKGDEPILHKTFHCYTVRAGQGGAQSARDNQTAGSHPKSAGASLRRYNETSLVQHVRDIIEIWKPEIAKSSLILYRAAGPYNRSVLFGGKTPLLDKQDPRLRTVPFSTRRPTFTEVKRIHEILSAVQVYGLYCESVETATRLFVRLKTMDQGEQQSRRCKTKLPNVNRAKSREVAERELPAPLDSVVHAEYHAYNALVKSKSPKKIQQLPQTKSEDDDSGDEELIMTEQTISFAESLKKFDDSLTFDDRNLNKKKKQPKKSKNQKLKEAEEARKKEVCEVIRAGDIERLQKILHASVEDNKDMMKVVNEKMGEDGNSLLHIASSSNQIGVISFLLDNGADVCAKNTKQQTAYTITQDKDVREMFKQFALDNPDKFNYNKANIPLNTLSQDDIVEKKRLQRKAKRQKEKEKKKENEIKKQEEIEKDRFLQLSDREKRALAAERRILNLNGMVISRCFLCASDMSGKVPFEYGANRFCSMECLKAHRLRSPVILST
ncbi:ankyrin repeat and zinc finger domain-containing protein 1 [Holotrichia oblita]|uniref:Ankyrin repeat and zinc finger domain-containing protein 1 n=1 Tax=Holotrichia oblita TaxID=644536 RepID=A0ACB9SRP3_HOLOL|nr:ankyrin repeat and zinc finger domain-containing protein 1 [Holotrichia oblita]